MLNSNVKFNKILVDLVRALKLNTKHYKWLKSILDCFLAINSL